MSVTPSSPVVGVFTGRSMAEQAVRALYDAGFEREQIRYSAPANFGSFIEGLKSLLTGTSSDEGTLINDFTSMGLSDEEARYYSNEYSNGHIILAVQAPGHEQLALSVLYHYGAYNSQNVSNQATNYAQQSSHYSQQNNYGTLQPQNNLQNGQTSPQSGTAAEGTSEGRGQDVASAGHNIVDESTQPAPSGYYSGTNTTQATQGTSESEAETRPPQADIDTSEYDAGDTPAQSNNSAPDSPLEAELSQANTFTSEQGDEFEQLQEQLLATQQQLQEAKTQLQAAREREAQLRTARERAKQLQAVRQQLQDLQSELAATLAELQETQARLTEYQ